MIMYLVKIFGLSYPVKIHVVLCTYIIIIFITCVENKPKRTEDYALGHAIFADLSLDDTVTDGPKLYPQCLSVIIAKV